MEITIQKAKDAIKGLDEYSGEKDVYELKLALMKLCMMLENINDGDKFRFKFAIECDRYELYYFFSRDKAKKVLEAEVLNLINEARAILDD